MTQHLERKSFVESRNFNMRYKKLLQYKGYDMGWYKTIKKMQKLIPSPGEWRDVAAW